MRGKRLTSGFTLVEMLVAIALLGLVGVISWRGLDYVAGQRDRIDRDTDELSRILRVLSQLERDVAQRVPDVMLPAPSASGLLPVSMAVMAAADGSVALEIVRLSLELLLVLVKDMTPAQRQAIAERHEKRMAFWEGIIARERAPDVVAPVTTPGKP